MMTEQEGQQYDIMKYHNLNLDSKKKNLIINHNVNNKEKKKIKMKPNIAVIGAGWWAQGWHIPQLHRNEENVSLVAIIDKSFHPKSNLNPNLESLVSLGEKYSCYIFQSVCEFMNHNISTDIDGIIVSTNHATHYDVVREVLSFQREKISNNNKRNNQGEQKKAEKKKIHIFMEKPITTNVHQCKKLHNLVMQEQSKILQPSFSNDHDRDNESDGNSNGSLGSFWINNSANYRRQCQLAKKIVQERKSIGIVNHVSCNFVAPLSWIFDDPNSVNWNEPDQNDNDMIGNGFAWGQTSHILAWIYHVIGCNNIKPKQVFCAMTNSNQTGADISHSATIKCTSGCSSSSSSSSQNNNNNGNKNNNSIIINLSGTSSLPGQQYTNPPVAKLINIQIFGTNGVLLYEGNDCDPKSGQLEVRYYCDKNNDKNNKKDDNHAPDVEIYYPCPELGFQFENVAQEGIGPESLQYFIQTCAKEEIEGATIDNIDVGTSSEVGFRCVQTIDCMYRSNKSGNVENVLYYSP